MDDANFTRDIQMRAMHSRFVLVGICAWISVCLLVAGWMPDWSGNLHTLWLISGLMGLVSAVGLAETIKSDVRLQENLLNEYMHAALTDALTGLANRHSLDRMLSTMLKESAGRRAPVSMIMIDIDHFKAFNDQWGHQAGDAVLRCVSKKMSEFFGNKAFVARYGGEEFAVVLPTCRLRDAEELAENCRETVKLTTCEFRERTFRITISCGITEANSSDTADSLTQRADMALYTAKRMGRDMIWVADPNSSQLPLPAEKPAEKHMEKLEAETAVTTSSRS
ncbi:GGDEF domain-containing protein [Planctomicrobium piriforme]|uniref:diguanylate cyclase n=1 Tax=Planctomicrobium piriforme TaxID=1576369 RepID=A0A1I3RQY2_9PLAN|nr:GGDEF domain-containing protein [Planctomicrobium piriforme]SFJ47697.1 diguanylate cyclase (GGDEF) domain-containing protein [Planctomicrobium piriforme]